jgi:hypothetical protein
MKDSIISDVDRVEMRRTHERGQARIIILTLVSFLIGVAVSALWFSRKVPAEVVFQGDVANDLARPASVTHKPQSSPSIDLAALEAVKRSIPDVNSASLEAGKRILREAAVTEFEQAVLDLQTRQKKAEQDFIQGQINNSDEQQRVATKKLQELQSEQMEKLKQIAANSKAQIDAFEQLKGASR